MFSGDSQYRPTSVTRVIYVRANVSETLSGYYASTRIRGITYWLFHRRALIHVHVTVRPNKSGQRLKFELQEHDQGAWHGVTTRCGTLNSSSKISAAVGLTHANLGYHYRIQADYIRSARGRGGEQAHGADRSYCTQRGLGARPVTGSRE